MMKKNKVFNLSTKNTTYLLGLYKDKILMHIYYGNRISSEFSIDDVLFLRNTAFSARISIDENFKSSEENMNLEYSCFGNTDLREPSFFAKYADGSTVTKAFYDGYRIFKGKPELNNLPSAYTEENDKTETLEIKLTDKRTGLVLFLYYTVYENFDIITRSVKVLNCGNEAVQIEKIMSLSLDMQGDDFELISLCGGWAKERHIKKTSLTQGIQKFGSIRGHSSHQHNPFFA